MSCGGSRVTEAIGAIVEDVARRDREGREAPDERQDARDQAAFAAVERELAQLFRSVGRLSRTMASEVHPHIDSAAYAMLALVDRDGSARVCELSGLLGLNRSTVSRQVSSLVELGLLIREPDPLDGRSALLSLSSAGAQRLQYTKAGRRRMLRAELSSWPDHDIAELARLLGRLNNPVRPAG